jgi:hypothetical protein
VAFRLKKLQKVFPYFVPAEIFSAHRVACHFHHRKFCVSRTQHYYRALPKRQSRKTMRFPFGCGREPQIMTLNSREAKDFLVQEFMRQAALDRCSPA